MKKIITITILMTVIFFTFGETVFAVVNRWDTEFGGVGWVTHHNAAGGNSHEIGSSVEIQSDNKYIVAGQSYNAAGNSDLAIWRYNNDGTLDTTFNGVGYVTHHDAAGGDGSDYGQSIQVQTDGKYVVTGRSMSASGNSDLALWRYNENGTLDTTFSSTGYVTHNSAAGGNDIDHGNSVRIQTDGRYIVAGYSRNASGNFDLAVWRFNSDGTLDTSFNGSGFQTFNSSFDDYDIGSSIEIQKDGKYIVVGASTNSSGDDDLVVWRYTSSGLLDTTFNSIGYVTHNGAAGGNDADTGFDLSIQSDGKYVVTGYSRNGSGNYDMTIWRYGTDGTLDTTFNGTGYVVHDGAAGGNNSDTGYSLEIQNDGKYVISGYSRNISGNADLAIWRYNNDGTLDTTFNGVGYVVHDSAAGGSGSDYGSSIQLQADGRYVVAGYSFSSSGNYDLVVWRYHSAYQVSNILSSLDTEDITGNNVEVGTDNGLLGTNKILLKKTNDIPLAEIYANFTNDLDWSTVTADSSLLEYKSFVSGLIGAPGAADTFSLYVPKRDGDEGVGICPEADELSIINNQCPNIYYLSSEDLSVSEVIVNDIDYWKVDGMTGTGGYSVTELPETGSSISMLYVVGVILVAVYSILYKYGSKKLRPKS